MMNRAADAHDTIGHDGGTIVFTGTPRQLVETGTSLTAQHLRDYVSAWPDVSQVIAEPSRVTGIESE